MSREIYTYTSFSQLVDGELFQEIKKYPQIAVSSSFRNEVAAVFEVAVTDFHTFSKAMDREWSSVPVKFNELIFLSEYIRKKQREARGNQGLEKWLNGCLRNVNEILSSILLMEEAGVQPEDLEADGDRNLELFLEAWRMLKEQDLVLGGFQERMGVFRNRSTWWPVFNQVFHVADPSVVKKVVLHGFYYFTPYQEFIMKLLEKAGIELVFLFPYDERYSFVYEVWEKTYSEKNGYPPKSQWHMEKTEKPDAYGDVFEGKKTAVHNKLQFLEYASIMEFVDEMKMVRQSGYTIYSSNCNTANKILKDYFPEEFGERKILSYPIGQFICALNEMWDEEKHAVVLDEDRLIECFSSGWLAYEGVTGKEYIQELVYILPFFRGCHIDKEWEERICKLEEVYEKAVSAFRKEKSPEEAAARWQEIMENPFLNFGPFAVPPEKLKVILILIRRILNMAQELFCRDERVTVQEHVFKLDRILKSYEMSNELYEEERELVKDIFEQLGKEEGFRARCYPADISHALNLFLYGRLDDGEIQTTNKGMVNPLFMVDAVSVKGNGKVHVCLCDVNSMPGKNKSYIWPLSRGVMEKCLKKTGNSLIKNLMWILDSNIECNRYFMYSALKNKEVQVSWVNKLDEKILAPSSYIRLVCDASGIEITPPKRNRITYDRVAAVKEGTGKILPYRKERMPEVTAKEARMDYALCPMRYALGYIAERYPVYQTGFQQTYAVNALISAMTKLMKGKNVSMDEVYRNVIALFPNFRKAEKRQVYDYLKSDTRDEIEDYTGSNECEQRRFTEERLRVHFPDRRVRKEAEGRYAQLVTPDGRNGMNLYEKPDGEIICTFCPHVEYCRNALHTGDQEKYYD